MLAAPSSIIALSIGSPPCDPSDTTLNGPGPSGESGWKAAYAGARMAVEIAKESSDMFLPLKAVVGALAVLIKSYDVSPPQVFALPIINRSLQQTTANADQIKEIEGRIESLAEVLASPAGDQDSGEKARREVLRKFVLPPKETPTDCSAASIICRKLNGIVAKLGPLSEQHGLLKFLKNADHANTLNGFVQDLAYAVTDHQVWVPDSTTRVN